MELYNIPSHNIAFYRTWENFRINLHKPHVFWSDVQKGGITNGQLGTVHMTALWQY